MITETACHAGHLDAAREPLDGKQRVVSDPDRSTTSEDPVSALSKVGAITLFVDDVARSKAWYQRIFERPVIYEDDDSSVLQFENMIVNLLTRSASHELIAPSTVAPGGAGATFQLTIWVDDANTTCATLTDRGAKLINGPIDRAWGQRTACFADPDGHLWEIAQTLT